MSGPNEPARSGPRIMPPGQTRKPGGADRLPQGGPPQQSPAAARIIAANKMGVPPQRVQASATPRGTPPPRQAPRAPMPPPNVPAPPPVQPQTPVTPALSPLQVPLPQPRPQGIPQGDSFANRFAAGDGSMAGDPTMLLERFRQSPSGNRLAAGMVGDNAGAILSALRNMISASAVAKPTAEVPSAAPPIADPVASLPQLIAQNRMPEGYRPSQATANYDQPRGAPPPVREPPPMPPPAEDPPIERKPVRTTREYKPSVQVGETTYEQRDLPETTKDKKGKFKPIKQTSTKNTSGNYGPNFSFYHVLGLPDRGVSQKEVNAAIQALRDKFEENPLDITPEEDRILASIDAKSGKRGSSGELSSSMNQSLEPADVEARFKRYRGESSPADQLKAQTESREEQKKKIQGDPRQGGRMIVDKGTQSMRNVPESQIKGYKPKEGDKAQQYATDYIEKGGKGGEESTTKDDDDDD